jgi:hypothetical protein
MYLYYLGITKKRADLRHRLSTHAHGTARRSTLRLVLAGLGAVEVVPEGSGRRKVKLPYTAERELTAWIGANLRVSWLEVPSPGDLEAALIAELRPPLNLEHNKAHPMYAHVKASRAAFRGTVALQCSDG